MNRYPFEDAKPIVRRLTDNGHQAFFVGGSVRDMLLGRTIGDIDIATSAQPEQVRQLFQKVIPVGMEHGTVIVRFHGESYEVTTFREDGTYSDGRHPDRVSFIKSIDEDLKRRDFTMNALAMSQNGSIYDPFDGKGDLEKKQICTVGDANERFGEDPLRMLRALRFSSQLGFSIETATLESMIQEQFRISDLAVERITIEITKLFAGEYVCEAVHYLRMTAIGSYLPVIRDDPDLIMKLPDLIRPLQRFAEVMALFHLLNPIVTINTWADQWKTSNKEKKIAMQLVNAWRRYREVGLDKWLIYQLDENLIPAFVRVGQNLVPHFPVSVTVLQQEKRVIPIGSLQDLDISGNDIVKLFPKRQKGVWIKNCLTALEQKVVFGELANDKNELKEWITWNPPVTN